MRSLTDRHHTFALLSNAVNIVTDGDKCQKLCFGAALPKLVFRNRKGANELVHKTKQKLKMNPKESEKPPSECPICCKTFPSDAIEAHVNRCIFLNCTSADSENEKPKENKRTFSVFNQTNRSPTTENKKFKKSETTAKRVSAPAASVQLTVLSDDDDSEEGASAVPSTSAKSKFSNAKNSSSASTSTISATTKSSSKSIPLAERMRPETIDDYIGQSHVMGKNTILRKILDKNETPSMILWGPPGVGKVNCVT